MSVRGVRLVAFAGMLQLMWGGSAFAQSCYYEPSCSVPCAPSCAAPCGPSCAAPGTCGGSACRSSGCGHCEKCCPRKAKLINIDFSRTVIKKNGGFFGGEPPAGIAVATVPALTVSTLAMPISLATRNDDVDLAISRAIARRDEARVAAGGSDRVCSDPCGSIKQLEEDMKLMKRFVEAASLKAEADNRQMGDIKQMLLEIKAEQAKRNGQDQGQEG